MTCSNYAIVRFHTPCRVQVVACVYTHWEMYVNENRNVQSVTNYVGCFYGFCRVK